MIKENKKKKIKPTRSCSYNRSNSASAGIGGRADCFALGFLFFLSLEDELFFSVREADLLTFFFSSSGIPNKNKNKKLTKKQNLINFFFFNISPNYLTE